MGTLLEDQYTFLITSRSVILTTRNISDENDVKRQQYTYDVILGRVRASIIAGEKQ